MRRASLCLLLLAVRAGTVGSDAANASPASLSDDDASDVGLGDAAALLPEERVLKEEGNGDIGFDSSEYDEDHDDSDGSSVEASRNKSAFVGDSPAFLRKRSNEKNGKQPAKEVIGGSSIVRKAFRRAIGGGVPGAIAGVVQVLSLMWLRTVINYQYRYGSSFLQALTTLYGMGGIPRLYSGVGFALVQAPLSRFVSTAANDGVSVLLSRLDWGPAREVVVAAFVVGFFRMALMPVDTCKTVMQIEGATGLASLLGRVRRGRVHLLYSGALANAASAWIGHYPWFYVYNLLSRSEAIERWVAWTTGRNALIGFASSIVSDTVSNFMRVIKTTKQSLGSTRSETTYLDVVRLILAVDGWRGLFGRGLKTRILGNALQSILFTVVWRGLSERWQGKADAETRTNKSPSAYGDKDAELKTKR